MIAFYGISHMIVGLVAGYLISKGIGFDGILIIPFCAFIVLGSLFPDIDCKSSMWGKWFFLIAFPLVSIIKHRGFFHTPLAAIIFSLIISVWSEVLGFGFIVGYVLHLICDTCNPSGIMWLYPFKKKYYSWNICRSGDEIGIIFLLLLVFFV